MAVSTLVSRPRTHVRPAQPARPASKPTPAPRRLEAITLPARLQEVEEQLLCEAMERHPGRERAVTHLLKDIEKPAGMTVPLRLTQPSDASQIERIEDLLLAAIMRTHPNRELAIDRLLGDVVGDAAIDDADNEEQRRAAADMCIDNDFDGLS